jgi:chromate transporter
MHPLLDVTLLALRLGVTAFGGPAAHVAMLRDEVVRRRQWMSDEEFVTLLGATNLIPGPNSTEMVMHVGLLRGGWRGLMLAGIAFVLPAALLVGFLAYLYVHFGTVPAAQWMLQGVKPVVIAIVLHALVAMARPALRDAKAVLVASLAFVAAMLTAYDPWIIATAGLITALPAIARRWRGSPVAILFIAAPVPLAGGLPTLAWTLLKIGALLYGSGYVLVGYLRDEFVTRLGWLTDAQLLDAVAIGQVTPGPVLTTATFVGYLTHGVAGAAVATVAIFAPAFIFVPILHASLERLRKSEVAKAFLSGVNAASIAVMAAVAIQLGQTAIVDIPTALLAIASLVALWRGVNSTWLIAAGTLAGYVMSLR